jgi:arylsulfatase A-like enzyme
LQENGYVTGGFGKWHLTPDNVQGAAGPFDHWPLAWGFDHYWGFLSGGAGQYDPIITQDNTTLGVQEGKDGKLYYFPDDLTDKAVEWLHAVRAQDAQKPWFMYYSTGCTHAPHRVAKEWADKYKGKFDSGWDRCYTDCCVAGTASNQAERNRVIEALFKCVEHVLRVLLDDEAVIQQK